MLKTIGRIMKNLMGFGLTSIGLSHKERPVFLTEFSDNLI